MNQITSMQQDILLEQELLGQDVNMIGGYMDIRAELDQSLFTVARSRFLKSCDAFWLGFEKGAKWNLITRESGELPELTIIDLRKSLSASEHRHSPETIAIDWMETEFKRPFASMSGWLFSDALIQVADNHFIYFAKAHHAIIDGWSFAIWGREIFAHYRALLRGDDPTSFSKDGPTKHASFMSYIQQEAEYVASEQYQKDKTWWMSQFDELPETLAGNKLLSQREGNHSTDNAQGNTPSRSERITIEISPTELLKLTHSSLVTNLGLPAAFIGALYAFFSQSTGQTDVVIGLPVHGRTNAQLKSTVGMLTNVNPLRIKGHHHWTFATLLHSVNKVLRQNFRHRRFPVGHLNRALELHKVERQQLFDISFNYQSFNISPELNGRVIESQWLPSGQEKTPLAFTVTDYSHKQRVLFHLDYATGQWQEEQARGILQAVLNMLVLAVSDEDTTLCQLPLITESERAQQLAWGRPDTDLNEKENASEQVARVRKRLQEVMNASSGRTSLHHQQQGFSYDWLTQLSDRIGSWVNRFSQVHHNGRVLRVGLCFERTPELVSAMVAIFQSRHTFVPLMPSFPAARLRHITNDAALDLVISLEHYKPTSDWFGDTPLLLVDRLISAEQQLASQAGKDETLTLVQNDDDGSDSLAYILYTSGTTGKPKGVGISRHSLANVLESLSETLSLPEQCKAVSVTNPVFDIFLVDVFLPLLRGGEIYLTTSGEATSVNELVAIMNRFEPQFMQATPATWRILSGSHWEGNSSLIALSGGEVLPAKLAQQLQDKTGRLFNGYGPTEATIYSLVAEVTSLVDCENITLAGPVAKTGHVVVNHAGNMIPQGMIGELCILGDNISTGYIGQADLTQARFAPLSMAKNKPVFRTGDLVAFQDDGSLAFYGRADQQVKINGHRIELQEIEIQLMQMPDVETAVVDICRSTHLLSGNDNGQNQLMAFIKPDERSTKRLQLTDEEARIKCFAELEQQLEAQLPAYMVPRLWRVIDSIPLTVSGKIDRQTLMQQIAAPVATFVKPESEMEIWLLQQWLTLFFAQSAQAKSVLLEQAETHNLGATTRFFDLGGNSLSAMQLVNMIRESWNVDLTIRDIFANPTIKSLATFIENAQDNAVSPGVVLPAIKPAEYLSEVGYQLSYEQQRLWFMQQLDTEQSNYVISFALQFDGEFSPTRFGEALSRLITRQESLQLNFIEVNGEPRAFHTLDETETVVAGSLYSVIDLSLLNSAERHQKSQQLLVEEQSKGFNLACDRLIRAQVIKLDKHQHIVQLSLHHIIADGWSLGVLIRELFSFYDKLSHDSPLLQELAIHYQDYVQWQREWLQSDEVKRQLAWWKTHLADAPERHQLPTDYSRPGRQQFNGAVIRRTLTPNLMNRLSQLASRENVSVFTLFYSALNTLLCRYSQTNDIVIGTTVANRHHQQLHHLVGLFVNTLVLRTPLDLSASFTSQLQKSHQAVNQVLENQHVPFDMLVEAIKPNRDQSYHPLFQVMISMQGHFGDFPSLPDVSWQRLDIDSSSTKFDLSLGIEEQGEQLALEWEYCTDLFSADTVQRLALHFEQLLAAIVEQPEMPLALLSYLSAEEQQQLLDEGLCDDVSFPGALLFEQFEARVVEQPNKVAVVSGNVSLTYQQLNQQANQMASELLEQGVTPDKPVGVWLDSSIEFIVAMLAVSKSGGAWLPLDTRFPISRICETLADSQSNLLITGQNFAMRLTDSLSSDSCLLEDFTLIDVHGDFSHHPTSNLTARQQHLTTDNLAYLIYTSGSTGKPKGVMVEHRAIISHLSQVIDYYQLSSSDNVLQFTSPAFDPSVEQVWSALSVGATVFVNPMLAEADVGVQGNYRPLLHQSLWDSEQFATWLLDNQITIADLPPAWASQIMPQIFANESFWAAAALRMILIGGEEFPVNLARSWQQFPHVSGCRLINVYGPTEACVTTHVFEVKPDTSIPGALPIGRPLSKTQSLVLDSQQQLVPDGIVGELYIGGLRLARGYLNRPDESARVFLPHPYRASERLYRTGDLVSRNKEGELVYLGRTDKQVQLRGYRIETGEIANRLQQLPDIESAVVVVKGEGEQAHLVAWVLPTRHHRLTRETSGDERDEQLMRHCREKLADSVPEYMVPELLIPVSEIPMTVGGKIDFERLPAPDLSRLTHSVFVQAATDTERHIQLLWQAILQLDKIGIDDNFFKLGGHSLLATRLVSALRQTFDAEIPLRIIFEQPTIRQLAVHMDLILSGATPDDSHSIPLPSIPRAQREKLMPASFAQQRFWFIDQLEEGSEQYNMVGAFRMKGVLNMPVFEACLQRLIQRHDVLRTHFVEKNGEVWTTRNDNVSPDITCREAGLSIRENGATESQLLAIIDQIAATPFDLTRELMIKVHVVELAQDDRLIVFVLHHIAADGWSVTLLMDEFTTLYRAFSQGQIDPLPPLAIQYVDYAVWQRQWLQNDVLKQQVDYWQSQLRDCPVVHQIPLDFPRPVHQQFAGALHFSVCDSHLTERLNQFCHQHDVTRFMLLETVFALLLHRYSGEQDIMVGTSIAGRYHRDIESLCGCFVNTLALRTVIDDTQTFEHLLQQNRQTIVDAYAHQYLPFELLVDELNPERSLSYNPLLQVLFTLHNNEQKALNLADSVLTEIQVKHQASPFDLELDIEGEKSHLNFQWKFNKALFMPETIARMAQNYLELLQDVLEHASRPMTHLSVISEEERYKLFVEWRPQAVTESNDQLLHQKIEQRADVTPDAIAAVQGERQVTYRELNQQANRIAHCLIAEGVRPDRFVGILTDPGIVTLAGILGILKAGAAYIPMDPVYPENRILDMLSDSGTNVLLIDEANSERITDSKIHRINIQAMTSHVSHEQDCSDDLTSPDIAKLTAEHLAYAIYTSGSTGKPKGVLVPHRGVMDYLNSATASYYTDDLAGSVIATSFSFDATVPAIYLPLMTGGTVYLPERNENDVLSGLWQTIRDSSQPLLIRMTPTHCRGLLNDEHQVISFQSHHFVIGGEVMLPTDLERLRRSFPAARIFNHYGPTEGIVGCTMFDTSDWLTEQHAAIPVGKPLPGTEIYILDNHQQLVPIGVVGELYVGRQQLAAGYHRRPDLTESRFIPNTFGFLTDKSAPLLYKTGDSVRWLPDGNIEYVGRKDTQVKLRGYRIELEEIEAIIARHTSVKSVAVLVRGASHAENPEGSEVGQTGRLMAWIEPDHASQSQGLLTNPDNNHEKRAFIQKLRLSVQQHLPSYMVPDVFCLVAELPLTPNGKVDRQRLPNPEQTELRQHEFVAPISEQQQQLCDIWQTLLGLEQVGIEDNFFESGGDSIVSVQLVSRARKAGMSFTVRQLFEYQTIARLTPHIKMVHQRKEVPQRAVTGGITLSPVQAHFFARQLTECHHYNQSVLLHVPAEFSPSWLNQLVKALYQRHDGLRLCFENHGGIWSGWHRPVQENTLEEAVFSEQLPDSDCSVQNETLYQRSAHYHQSFDLTNGPLFKAVLFKRQPGERQTLLLVAHHLIVDGVSWRILLSDLQQGIEQLNQSRAVKLADKTSSYQQWTAMLESNAERLVNDCETDWWCQQLLLANQAIHPWLAKHELASAESVVSEEVHQLTFNLSGTHTQSLTGQANRLYRTTTNELILAALLYASHEVNQQESLALYMEGHGRDELCPELDVSETVGWFTSIYPFVMSAPLGSEAGDVVKYVKDQFRQIPGNGIGYGLLRFMLRDPDVITLSKDNAYQRIVFNNLGQFDGLSDLGNGYQLADERQHDLERSNLQVQSQLVITCWQRSGQLHFSISFSDKWFNHSLVGQYVKALRQTLIRMAEEFNALVDKPSLELKTLTPSDFDNATLSQEQLDNLPLAHNLVEAIYDTTSMQQGMLFHSMLDGNGASYTNQLFCDFVGEVQITALSAAWQVLVSRHEALRTSFIGLESEQPQQIVRLDASLALRFEDWRDIPEERISTALNVYRKNDKSIGFNLQQAPLIRIHLIQLSDERYHFIWTHHHLLTDGWCTPILFNELLTVYRYLVEHNCLMETGPFGQLLPKALPDNLLRPTEPFESYVKWLKRQDMGQARGFWQKHLAGLDGVLLASCMSAKELSQEKEQSEYAEQTWQCPDELYQQLEQLANRAQVTLNVLVQYAWAYLIHRYSHESSVVFGATVSGRPADLPGIESMIGLFINTIPVRLDIESGDKVFDSLHMLHKGNVQRDEFSYLSLSDIVRQAGLQQASQLFDSLLVFENYPIEHVFNRRKHQSSGLTFENLATREETNFPLTLTAIAQQGLTLAIGYRPAMFSSQQVADLLTHLSNILTGLAAADADTLNADLPLMNKTQIEQVVQGWNQTQQPQPEPLHIAHFFEQQVRKSPDAVAVQSDDEQVTWFELDTRANQLANYLVAQGVGPEVTVGICMQRSVSLMVSILAVIKSAGAWVPLDPDYPAERLKYIINDAGTSLILSNRRDSAVLPICDAAVAEVDHPAFMEDLETHYATLPPSTMGLCQLAPEHMAYVLYTSGSTGNPKGVVIEHQALMARLLWIQRQYQVSESDVFILKTPYSFDVSMWEVFWPVFTGASLVIAKPDGHKDPHYLTAMIQRYGVTVINFVPSMLAAFMEADVLRQCRSLRYVLSSGEALSLSTVDAFYQTGLSAQLHNLYGPTEATIDASWWDCRDYKERSSVPIGFPVDNTRLYVLDEQRRLVPPGVNGELYIAGDGLARGYLNRPELTASAFINDSVAPVYPGDRMYRTGDIARWNYQGELEYSGRKDQQAKIRGYRIEPGEIEAQLMTLRFVKEAVVLVKADSQGRNRLAACLLPEHNAPDRGELTRQIRHALSERLPDFMVPGEFIVVDSFPLLASGKVDRKSLAKLSGEQSVQEGYVAPRNQTETDMVNLWQKVLGVDKVGVDDNFFSLGGDSIISIQLVSQARLQGLQFSVKQLFEQQTISRLVPYVVVKRQVLSEQGPVMGDVALTPIQRTFFNWQLPEQHHFNQSFILTTPTSFSKKLLPVLADALLQRHDGLRLRFRRNKQGWRAMHQPCDHHVLLSSYEYVNLSSVSGLARKNQLAQRCEQIQASLDIEHGPLFKLVWFDFGDEPGRLLIVVHHLMVDGISWRILLSDLSEATRQFMDNKAIALPAKTTSWQQWSQTLMDYSRSDAITAERDYWISQLRKPFVKFPAPPSVSGYSYPERIHLMTFTINSQKTQELLGDCNQAYRTQINELLLAALMRAYQQWSYQSVLRIDLEAHGREDISDQIDISQTVGWFTSIYPLVLDIDVSASVAEVIKQVKEQYRAVPAKGVGFGVLKELVRDEEIVALEQEERGDIVFNYLGQFDQQQSQESVYTLAQESPGKERSDKQSQRAALVINGWVSQGTLTFELSARTDRADIDAMVQLHELFEQSVHEIIANCHERINQRHLFEIGKGVIVGSEDQDIEGVEI